MSAPARSVGRAPVPGASSLADVFNPGHNSIGFLRWLMAFLVIFSHSGPLAGFYGGHDLGTQISTEQSLGGVAVAGFFFFSGYLITTSRMGKSTVFRYFWRRGLRIFPAFWAALIFTVLVLAPIAWRRETGSWDGYWDAPSQSPLTYFINNMWLILGQRNIAEMGSSLPYAQLHGAYDWNGSAWTLMYEFFAYIVIGLLGLFGVLAYRWLAGAIAVTFIVLNAAQWMGAGNVGQVFRLFQDPFMLMFLAPFAFGMLFALYPGKIPIDDRLAVLAILIAITTYGLGGWNIFGQYAFMYFLMWLAIRLPLQNWEKFGDLSYGIYIFAWPVMQFAAYFDVQRFGWLVYHLVIVVVVHILAFTSWHLIERPAMSLKNWTPRWLAAIQRRAQPAVDAVARAIVAPAYSSTRLAATLRSRSAAEQAPAERAEPAERTWPADTLPADQAQPAGHAVDPAHPERPRSDPRDTADSAPSAGGGARRDA